MFPPHADFFLISAGLLSILGFFGLFYLLLDFLSLGLSNFDQIVRMNSSLLAGGAQIIFLAECTLVPNSSDWLSLAGSARDFVDM